MADRVKQPEIQTTAEAHEASALPPRAHAVLTDPDAPCAAVEMAPLPEAMTRAPLSEKSEAQWAYERLILYIRNFETTLDANEEVAMGFTGGDAGVIRIEGLGYFDPDIVTFYGTDPSGAKTQLIQHVSQLNVLLRAAPRPKGTEKPQRIGFRLARELEDATA